MKKSIVMVAAMLVAASAQAVTLTWASNTATSRIYGLTPATLMTVGATGETIGMTVYYILAADYATVLTYTGATSESQVGALDKATSLGSTSTSTTFSGRFSTSSSVLGSASGVSYFARAYATFGGADYYMDLRNGGSYWTTVKDGNATVTESFSLPNATYGGATGTAGSWGTWVPVPEPATGALALAGAALLLRRRRRA